MNIKEVPQVLNDFINAIAKLMGKKIECEVCKKIPAGKFPDIYKDVVGSRKEGCIYFLQWRMEKFFI